MWQRTPSAALLLLGLLTLVLGCNSGTYVIISIEPAPGMTAAVTRIDLQIELDGTNDGTSFAPGGEIVLPTLAALDFGDREGSLSLSAVAYGADGVEIGRGGGALIVTRGQTAALTIQLALATPGSLVAEPGVVLFPAVHPGSADPPASGVTISNGGDGPIGPLAVFLSATQSFAIAEDGCSGITLERKGGCKLTLRFQPQVGDADELKAEISVRGGTEVAVSVPLRGTVLPRPALRITSLSPARGPTTGGVTLTIKGEQIPAGPGMRIDVDGVAATDVTWISAGEVRGRLPARPGKAGPVDVAITAPNGQSAVAAKAFSYYYGTLQLAASVQYATGAGPYAVAAGDLNRDGIADLVVPNDGSATLSVLLGTGGGRFALPLSQAVLASPNRVFIYDFNRDGMQDVAVTHWGGRVGISMGRGDGTFSVPAEYPAGGSGTISIQAADLSGDAVIDLVVANRGGSNVGVLLGKPDGTFKPVSAYAAGPDASCVVVGDLDGNGLPDLAVGHHDGSYVAVLLNQGGGTFGAPSFVGGDANMYFVTLADIDNDRKLDILSTSWSTNKLSVLRGVGDGTFQPATQLGPGGSLGQVLVADLNQDGSGDAILANGTDVMVLMGKGDGAFAAAQRFSIGRGAKSAFVGDISGDGKPDVITVDAGAGSVSVLINTSQ